MIGTIPRLYFIKNRYQLADAIGVPVKYLINRAFEVDQSLLYSEFAIPKRSGGERTIHAPYWPTANTQNRIRELLEELYHPSNRVMGFVKKRGIRDNAKFHVGKRLILNIDIKDYFGSIHFGRIRSRLMAAPYSLTNDVATMIAKLCTLDGFLPTGASTSPILANIVSSALDGAIAHYAKQRGCFYTRYADDITFSTNRSVFPNSIVRRSHDAVSGVEVAPELGAIIERQGFVINARKTRLMTKHMRQEVCGVTCNERLNVRRSFYREVRATLHAWRKHGREAAERVWQEKYNWRHAASLERALRGKIEHIIHVRGANDKAVNNLVCQFNDLPERHFQDIRYDYFDSGPLGIEESVCLIESADEENMIWAQGSGFIIEGGAVVTNHHVVSYASVRQKEFISDGEIKSVQVPVAGKAGRPAPRTIFPVIRLTLEGNPLPFDMQIIHSDPSRDLAILHPLEPAWKKVFSARACQLSFAPPDTGTHVSLVGYPDHVDGSSCKVTQGHITGKTKIEGQTYFTISQIIVKGNSGGPVVDKFGQVIGIATKGVDSSETINLTYNGCIPIHSLDKTLLVDN